MYIGNYNYCFFVRQLKLRTSQSVLGFAVLYLFLKVPSWLARAKSLSFSFISCTCKELWVLLRIFSTWSSRQEIKGIFISVKAGHKFLKQSPNLETTDGKTFITTCLYTIPFDLTHIFVTSMKYLRQLLLTSVMARKKDPREQTVVTKIRCTDSLLRDVLSTYGSPDFMMSFDHRTGGD